MTDNELFDELLYKSEVVYLDDLAEVLRKAGIKNFRVRGLGLMRQRELAGHGHVMVGRRGRKTRFVRNVLFGKRTEGMLTAKEMKELGDLVMSIGTWMKNVARRRQEEFDGCAEDGGDQGEEA